MPPIRNRLIHTLERNSELLNLNVDNLSDLISNLTFEEVNTQTNTEKMDVQAFAKLLPTFDGNSDHLEHFINSIDDFYNSFCQNTTEIQKKYVFYTIKSKLVGDAHNLLYCRPDLTTWTSLKTALRQKFGDPISFFVLLHQLNYFNKERNENLMDFVIRLKQFMQRINAKIQSEEADENVRRAFRNQAEKSAIITLISNSPDVVKNQLLTTKPETLDQALSSISEYNLIESQINLRIQLNRQNTQKHNIPGTSNHSQVNPRFNTNPRNGLTNQRFPTTAFPSQPIPVQPRSNIQHRFPTNIQAFRGPKQNVFTPQRNTTFPKPTPMSSVNAPIPDNIGSTGTVSMKTYRPNLNQRSLTQNHNHFQNVGPSNKYTFQELTNLECSDVPISDEEQYPEQEYMDYPNFLPDDSDPLEQEPENFPITASPEELT